MTTTSLYCPHCSRSIESHDGKPCPREFSRRFFFGLLAGAGAAAAMPSSKPKGNSGDFSLEMVEALDRYVSDLRRGFVDPGSWAHGIYYFQKPTNYFVGLEKP